MTKFYYKILTKDSRIEEGHVFALIKKLAEIKLKKNSSSIILLQRENLNFWQNNIYLPFLGFSVSERINFFRNLAAMNSAGVSIVKSLEVLSEQVRSKKLKEAILDISNEAKNGQQLSKSMAKYPRYFSEFLIETVNMGEVSGRLTETLDSIAEDLEKDDELKKKIKGALAYPIVVVTLMLVIAVALMVFLLPSIENLFVEMGAPIPLPTRILLFTGNFISNNPFIVLAIVLIVILIFFIANKNKKSRYYIHKAILRIPVFGPLIKDYNLVLFFRSLESLIKSGISIVYAVDIAKKTVSNDVYKRAIEKAQPILFHGVPLTDVLKSYPDLFPPQTQKIIEVGESVGQMEETLKRTTHYFERAVDYKTKMIIVLIEPILMVVLGIIVAGLALSVFMPLYQLASII